MSGTGDPLLKRWISMARYMGNQDMQTVSQGLHLSPEGATAPMRRGLACGKGSGQVLDSLGVPRDARGIVLLCGYVASAAFGLIDLLSRPGDSIGWAYIGVAAIGYFFIQTRGLTAFLWLLFAAGGAAVLLA